MSKLVITEKPSVAHTIAAVLGADARMDGYLEGGGYIVSWCVGHLAELANAEEYDSQFAKWRIEDLPILPDNWRYAVPHNKQKRFAVLRSLMDREDVTEIVNACDAGREGELIFRKPHLEAEDPYGKSTEAGGAHPRRHHRTFEQENHLHGGWQKICCHPRLS